MKNKKSQYWYIDLMSAITIFTLILFVAFRFISGNMIYSDDSLVLEEANRISGTFMTPGIPKNWTEEYVLVIGLTSEDNIINVTKVDQLSNMTKDNYADTKSVLSLQSDFLMYFEDRTGNIINFTDPSYIGKSGITPAVLQANDPEDIVALTRYLVYRHDDIAEIIAMKVILWEEQ